MGLRAWRSIFQDTVRIYPPGRSAQLWLHHTPCLSKGEAACPSSNVRRDTRKRRSRREVTPLELVMEQGPTACYRAPMRPHLPALLSLMVVISCRDGDDPTATEPGSTSTTSTSADTGSSTSPAGAQRALGETCDPNAGDDECAAGLFCDFPQCGSSELTWFGFCSPIDCVTDDDCATVDGLQQVCDKYEEPGFTASWCRWNCVTDADCPDSLVSNLTCQPYGLNEYTCQAPCPSK